MWEWRQQQEEFGGLRSTGRRLSREELRKKAGIRSQEPNKTHPSYTCSYQVFVVNISNFVCLRLSLSLFSSPSACILKSFDSELFSLNRKQSMDCHALCSEVSHLSALVSGAWGRDRTRQAEQITRYVMKTWVRVLACAKLQRERINCTSVYLFLYGESSVKISTQTDSY